MVSAAVLFTFYVVTLFILFKIIQGSSYHFSQSFLQVMGESIGIVWFAECASRLTLNMEYTTQLMNHEQASETLAFVEEVFFNPPESFTVKEFVDVVKKRNLPFVVNHLPK